MKLYAPKYYKDFKCTADKCSHSCCIGWEIDIDDNTYDMYKNLKSGYGLDILYSINNIEGFPHFKLSENDRCPHLDEHGLCKIITNLGEGYLCEICREHPRFYNDTPRGKEVGLGMACEEACRIILSSDSYDEFYVLEDLDLEADQFEFDPLPLRAKIFETLKQDTSFDKKLSLICNEFNVSINENVKNVFSQLEYLDPQHKELFLSCDFSKANVKKENTFERALAYFVYRHCTQAYDEDDFRACLGFSIFCVQLLRCLSNSDNVELIARIISEELEYSEENTEAIKENIL